MVQRIFSCFISLALCLYLCVPCGLAQTPTGATAHRVQTKAEKKKEKQADIPQYPLYNGVSVGLDLWGIGSKLIGGDNLSMEVAFDVNLKNRFFPTVELGYAKAHTEGDLGILYDTRAPYFRIGADYNALYKKKHGNMLLVGLRYAMTSYSYDIEAIGIQDPIYGGDFGNPNLIDNIWGGSIPYNYSGMKGSMHWLEICLGLRAQIWKDLYMGWALRVKYRLTESTGKYGDPWYVPGFGKYGSNTIGVTYTITYKLPF